MMRKYLLLFLLGIVGCPMKAAGGLRERIGRVIENVPAQVGVAVVLDGKDTLTVNNPVRYPLMSVMKYHQALAVAYYLDKRGLPLSAPVHVGKEDLRPDTYSPLREKYPEGDVCLTVAELLAYTLQLSDNNACDILFDYIGGVSAVDGFLRSIGCSDFSLSKTESDMHADPAACYNNWSTPLAAARLMDRLVNDDFPIDTVYTRFIRNTLLECRTGMSRLPFPVRDTGVRVGHKTGTSDRNADGEWIAINDVGFFLLPDGRRYTLAVFVMHSRLGFEETEKVMATLSEVVFRAIGGDIR